MQSQETNEIAAALCSAQSIMANAVINKVNPHFNSRYADLSSVREAVLPCLNGVGIAVTQVTDFWEEQPVLVTLLMHKSGQWIRGAYPLPKSATPQQMGSALTYARRYGLSAIACIAADEDDDGNIAEVEASKTAPPPPKVAANDNKPPKFDPPIDPKTGECSPHLIALDQGEMQWGGVFLAAVNQAKSAAEIDEWAKVNKTHFLSILKSAPKVHERIVIGLRKAGEKQWAVAEPGAITTEIDIEMGATKTKAGLERVWANHKAPIGLLSALDFDWLAKRYEEHLTRIERANLDAKKAA